MTKKILTPGERLGLVSKEIEKLIKENRLDRTLINEIISEIFEEEETASLQRLKVLCEDPYNTRCLISVFAETLFTLKDYKIESGHLQDPLMAVDDLLRFFQELVKGGPENGNIGVALAAGVYKRVQNLVSKIKRNPENRRYIVPPSLSGISYTDIIGLPFPRELEKALQILNNQDVTSKAKAIYLLAKHAGWNTLALHYIDEILSKVEAPKREFIIEIFSNVYLKANSDLLKNRKDLYQSINNLLLEKLKNLPVEYLKEIAKYYQESYSWKTKSIYRNPETLLPLLYVLESTPPKETLKDELDKYSKIIKDFYKLMYDWMKERMFDAYSVDFIIDNHDLINRLISSPLIQKHRNSKFVRYVFFEILEKILPYKSPLTEKEKRNLLSLLERAEKTIPYIPKIDSIIKKSRDTDLFTISSYLIFKEFKYEKDIENFERYLNEVEKMLDIAIKTAEKYGLKDWTLDARLIYDNIIEAVWKDKDLRREEVYTPILEEAANKSKAIFEIQKELGIEAGIWNRTLGPIYLLPPEELKEVLKKLLKDRSMQHAEEPLSSFLEKLNKQIREDYIDGKLDGETYELLNNFTLNNSYEVLIALTNYYKLVHNRPEKKEYIINYVREIITKSLEN